MDSTALFLSRLQFAYTISFHIIFPSFTIGLAAWLTFLEALHLATGRPAYRLVFEFWLKIFGVAFGLGVVSGIVMAFEFGTNWSELSRISGPIQGPLLSYETFTAFALWRRASSASCSSAARACRRGSICSRPRWSRWAPRSRRSGSWPTTAGCRRRWATPSRTARSSPTDWFKIIFSPVVWVRFPHMLLASYLTGAFCVAATGAWYVLRGEFAAEARIMLRMGLYLAAVVGPDSALLRPPHRRLRPRLPTR